MVNGDKTLRAEHVARAACISGIRKSYVADIQEFKRRLELNHVLPA